jgi:hypothetical protein
VEVVTRDPAARSHDLEVMAPNGWRVSLSDGFDEVEVMRLLKIVSRC